MPIVSTDPHEVHFVEQVFNSEAIPLVAEAWHSLLAGGQVGKGSFPGWGHSALFVKNSGIIIFKYNEDHKELYVDMSWVRPEDRKKGIFQSLWKSLSDHAKAKKYQEIAWSILGGNEIMKKLSDRVGKLKSINYSMKV